MAEKETLSLTFGITGEFITKVAKEWFFIEHKPYSVIEELLLSCMCGTDTPEGELKQMAQDVLIGKAEFRGNSWDGTFSYVTLDEPAKVNIFDEYCKLATKMKKMKERTESVTRRYNAMFDALQRWAEDDAEAAIDELNGDEDLKDVLLSLMSKYGEDEDTNSYTANPLVESYIAQARIEMKFDDNYGWLEPDGTFHPVPWCDHQEYAIKMIHEKGWYDEFDQWEDNGSIYYCGDFLTMVKGWVLLHNPGRGVAFVTRDENRRLTKSQREFLFDYFYQRGMKDKAKEYLED